MQKIDEASWGMRRTSIIDLNNLTNIELVTMNLVTTNVVKSATLNTYAGCILESHAKQAAGTVE